MGIAATGFRFIGTGRKRLKRCCRAELAKVASDLMDRPRNAFSDEVNAELDRTADWLRHRAET
jgi:hypothetical protein